MDALGAAAARLFLVGLGGFLIVMTVVLAGQVARDLTLRVLGLRVRATVSGVERERVDGDASVKEWVYVTFRTEQGQVLDDVRLRSWTTVAPRMGAQIRISYDPDDPRTADRVLIRLALVRLLLGVPLSAATGVFLAGTAFGLWDRWLGR